jgi:hypothetical protein
VINLVKYKIIVYFEKDDYLFLQQLANKKGLSLSAVIRILVREQLSHLKNANSQT